MQPLLTVVRACIAKPGITILYDDIFSPQLRKNDWNVVAFVAPWYELSFVATLGRIMNVIAFWSRGVAVDGLFVTPQPKQRCRYSRALRPEFEAAAGPDNQEISASSKAISWNLVDVTTEPDLANKYNVNGERYDHVQLGMMRA